MAKRPLFGPPLLRPFKKGERRPNADGSFSTEISMSAPDPFGHGQWMNFPSLWMGPNGPVQLLDDGAALNAAVNFEQFGSSFPRFATRQQAEKIAEDRSKAGGVGTGELAAPTNDKAGQDMSPYGLLYPGFMGQRFALPMQDDLSRLPPDRGLIGGDMPGQGPLPGPYELAAMRRPAPKPMPRARQVSGKPDGAGRPGEIRTGADGRNYQYAETTGMAGATGPQGWLQTNMPAAPQASPQSAPAGPLGGLFAPDNRDVLAALGIGMMRGDFSGGMADALKIKQGRAQENATRAWLMKRGLSAEDAAMAAQNPSLMSMLLKPGETDKYKERAAAAEQYGLDINSPEGRNFILTGDMPSNAKSENDYVTRMQMAAQLGLKEDDPAYKTFILTGKMPREDQGPLTAVDKKAILEADDMVAANENALNALDQAEKLSDKANSGWFAGTRAAIGNNLPDLMVPDQVSSPESSQATTDMDNAVVGQALASLKTIFGGNPTEGERAILLELQGSSSMPSAVRKSVFARAKGLAERRLAFNKQRADELRGQSYYKTGGMNGANADGWTDVGNGVSVRQVGP